MGRTIQPSPISYAPFFNGVPVLATLGDSRLAQGFLTQSGFNNNRALGANWLPALLGGRVRLPFANGFAVSGAKYADILATQISALRAAQAAGAGITHVILLCGTNDFGVTAQATIKAQCAQVWAIMKSMNIQIVQLADLPRSLASWTIAQQNERNEFNQWLKDYAAVNRVALVDPSYLIADPANANGDPLSGQYQSDGIHPAVIGAYQIGLALQTYFNTIALPGYYRPMLRGDVYDATNNPRGNLLPNGGIFSGTGGVNLGTGASGTVADGWRNRVVSGATFTSVASLVARTPTTDYGTGWWQQCVVTATTAGILRVDLPTAITGQAVGDIVWGEVDLNITNASKLLYSQLNVFDFGGASALGAEAFKDPGMAGLYMPSTYNVRLVTAPFQITTGNTDIPFRIELSFDAGGGATVQIGAASLRKVIAQ